MGESVRYPMIQNLKLKKFIENRPLFNEVFVKDCHDFFSKKKSGNLGNWRYEDGHINDPAAGAILWSRLVENATTYYVSRSGDQSVLSNLNAIADFIGQDSCILVDLGPGKLRTAKISLIEALAKNGVYVPVDISENFLNDAATLKRKGIVSDTLPITADFTTETLSIPYTGKRVFLFEGSTIGNIKAPYNTNPMPMALDVLLRIKRQMKKGDSLIVGFDSNQDGESVLKCYEDPYSIDVMLAPLFTIERDLPHSGNFDPSAYEPSFLWLPKTGQCAHTVIAKEDQTITFDNQTYRLREGQRLHVSNSYKFTSEAMKSLLTKAGLSDVAILSDKHSTMQLALGKL
jgi:L-histidine Nalpha-methyltransferase